jgi:hypothetical protein
MNMTRYFAGYISKEALDNHSTEKAFYTHYNSNGFGKGKPVWIPKSICKFGEPNEFGNMKVFIPQWFFSKNPTIDYKRFLDIRWCCNGEPFMVEM